MAIAAALIPAVPAIASGGILGVGGLIKLFRKTNEFAEKLKQYLEQAGSKSDEKTVQDLSKLVGFLSEQTISLQDEIRSTLTSQSLPFHVKNKTKNRRIKLYRNPTLHGHYILNGDESKEILPENSGKFAFEKRRGFFGCSGVLLSVLGGKIEYEIAIAFRNSMVQFRRKAGCKFAVTFTNSMEYKKLNGEKLYREMMFGKREKFAGKQFHRCLAADGPDDITNEEDEEKIMVWIEMSCEDEAECYVEFVQPETA